MNDYYVTRDEWLAAMLIEKAWWAKGIPRETPDGGVEWAFINPQHAKNAPPAPEGVTATLAARVQRGESTMRPDIVEWQLQRVRGIGAGLRQRAHDRALRKAREARRAAREQTGDRR